MLPYLNQFLSDSEMVYWVEFSVKKAIQMVYIIMYITKIKYIALCGGHSQKASYLSQFYSD